MEPARNTTEDELLRRVDRGLELAVRDLGLPWQDEGRVTKREKYGFIAIDAHSHELPITYSWFEYGVSAVAGKGFVSESMIVPRPDQHEILHMDASEIADYFVGNIDHLALEDWWTEPVLSFLEEFYEAYCPPHLREMYLSNIRLRKILENRIIPRINREGAGVPQEDYEDLREELLRIQTELASDEKDPAFDGRSLRDLYDEFLSYSELLDEAVLAASQREELEPNGPESEVITNLKSAFDDVVWPLITSIISYRTSRGPNPEEIRKTAKRKHRSVLSTYEREIETVQRQCQEAGLVLDIENYPVQDDSISNKVDELMNVVDGNHDGERNR